jgi:hypothetical protein
VKAGKEPRERLRYTPPAQLRETLLLSMRTSIAMGSPELPGEPVELPGTAMRMNVSVDSVKANGDISYRFDLVSVKVDSAPQAPELVAQIEAATRKLVGTTGRATLTERGVIEQLSIEMPEQVDAPTRELIGELERSMRQMSDPLPEEPIGVGARWDVHTKSSLRGIEIDQVRRYTLLERAAGTARMSVIVEQTARRQSIELPNAPPGAIVRLEQLASAGDGQVTVDTSKLVPRKSELLLRTTSIVNVDAEGRKATMRSDMQAEVSLSAVDGGGQ